jgi:exopolysaccharide production protein ExoZ
MKTALPQPNLTVTKPSMNYRSLDAWRGIAALWVVMCHMAEVILARYPNLAGSSIYWPAMQGSLGVQMFFVISGYCIINAALRNLDRHESTAVFLKARLRRIYPPMWLSALLAASVVAVMTWLVRSGRVASSVSVQNGALTHGALCLFSNATLTQLLFKQPFLQVQCWTLCYEAAFYGIVALGLSVALRWGGQRPLLNALHVLTSITLVLLIINRGLCLYPFDLWPQFGMGILVYDIISSNRSKASMTWLAVIAVLVAIFCIVQEYQIGAMLEDSRETFIFSAAFSLALIGLYPYDSQLVRAKPVAWLGSIGLFSYSLYLTHTFSIGLMHQLVVRFNLPESVNLIVFWLVIVGAILFARQFYVYCEKPFTASRRTRSREPVPTTFAETPVR